MRLEPSVPSIQEKDISLFLDSLGVKLPAVADEIEDGYELVSFRSDALKCLKAQNHCGVLLCYRYDAVPYPMSVLFLRGDSQITFCHSTLMLDSYPANPQIADLLRRKTTDFFATEAESRLRAAWPDWDSLNLVGQEDYRIVWDMKPTLPVAIDLFSKIPGRVPDLPLFPSVYPYNNPYVENLLEVGLPELSGCKRICVLGTGAGLDAVCIALRYDVEVDATDINPIAAANTIALARRVGIDKRIKAWVSDGFANVPSSYDCVFFEAPLVKIDESLDDPNRFDVGGKILRRVLADLPQHLNPDGKMYLMSTPNISPYLPSFGLQVITRRTFVAKSNVAIHEIRKC